MMENTYIQIKFLIAIRFCIAFFIICLLAISSCSKDKTSMPVEPEICDSITVTFQSDILSIMNTYCTFSGCHSYGSGVGNFSNYSGVKSKIGNGQLENRVLNLKDMPPTYSPGPKSINNDDLQKIECWIKDGALDN